VEVLRVGPEGEVEAWLLSPLLSPAASLDPAPLLIFAHGNGELIDHWLDAFDPLRRLGLAVLLVEYPGYGRSGGTPSEETIARTMAAAFDRVAARPDIDGERVVLYGRSVGGGAVAALARQRAVSAVVLESSFTSVRTLARRYGLFGPLVRDPFDVLSVIREYDGPVLVIHGSEDRLIPPAHGRRLATEATAGELLLLECGHNDCPRPWAEVRSFLERSGILPGHSGASVK
jgi:pimeloyl-ACP methyl ester carboxylesterase